MKAFRIIINSVLAVSLAVFFVRAANAAPFSFDGTAGGFSLSDAIKQQESVPVALPLLSKAAAPAGARVYDFRTLYSALGYPSPDYFGSTEDEVIDLETYTSKEDTYYAEVNSYLRFHPEPYEWYGTSPAAAKVMVANIDRVFDRVPSLPADLVMFRGLDLKYRGGKAYSVGEEFVDKGYISTSVSFKVARYFAIEMNNDGDEAVSRKAVFTIYMDRPGEKGILIDQSEDEVILKHGRKFRVMAKKAGVVKYDLYLVQACSGACSSSLPAGVGGFWSNFTVQD